MLAEVFEAREQVAGKEGLGPPNRTTGAAAAKANFRRENLYTEIAVKQSCDLAFLTRTGAQAVPFHEAENMREWESGKGFSEMLKSEMLPPFCALRRFAVNSLRRSL